MIRADVIRAVFTSPLPTVDAAALYGMSQPTVTLIRQRKTRVEVTAGLSLCAPLDRLANRKQKLSPRDAEEIRQLFAAGAFNQYELAALYGVSQTTIHKAVTFQSYKPAREIPCPGQKKISPPFKNAAPSRKRRSRIQRRRCRHLDA